MTTTGVHLRLFPRKICEIVVACRKVEAWRKSLAPLPRRSHQCHALARPLHARCARVRPRGACLPRPCFSSPHPGAHPVDTLALAGPAVGGPWLWHPTRPIQSAR